MGRSAFTPHSGSAGATGPTGATGPSSPQIACRVYNSGAVSIPDATVTYLSFDSERFDYGNMHSTGTNPGRITAPVKGVYAIGSVIGIDGSTGKRAANLRIRLNGTTLIGVAGEAGNADGWASYMSIATLYELEINDYVEIAAYHYSGEALNDQAAAAFTPEFYAALLFAT